MHNALRNKLKDKKRVVVKIGTSTLSFPSGRLNFQRIELLSEVLSTIRNSGKEIILVSSGAIGVGAGRMGLDRKPDEVAKKQALAAIGQAELMRIYQKFFEARGQLVAQVLLTKDIVAIRDRNINARNTLNKLLEMGIIPIINENDTIATDEIVFGDNDTLSAYVTELVGADLLIMLSDIDGLYSANPRTNPEAKIIPTVHGMTPEIEQLASGAGSSFGTGGMVTKFIAARICEKAGADMIIVNGVEPRLMFDIFEGKEVGTLFLTPETKE